MDHPLMRDLRRKAAGALLWSYGVAALRLAIQLGSAVVLARLLGPRPFGLVAAAWVMVGVAGQFVDCGFGSALVQRPGLNARQIRFAFTLQLLAGVALTALLALSARPLAGWLGNPRIAGVLALLSLALLLQALGQTAISLLRRALDMRTLQLAQLAGAAVGFGAVALPLARRGYGIESLVAGQLAQSLVTTAIAYAKVRHPLLPLLGRDGAGLFPFGLKVTTTNLVNCAIAGLDSLAMTRCFGAVVTGWFNRAQVLALGPGGQLAQILQSVLFPAYCHRTEDRTVLRQVYLASLAGLSLVLLPAGTVLAVTAPTVVRALYGPAWTPAASLLVPLALAMPVHGAMALNGPLLWACDRVGDELRVQCGVVVLFALVLAAAGRWTPAAMCWGILLVYAVRCAAMMGRALAAVSGAWRDCRRALRGPVALAAAAGGMAAAAGAMARGWEPLARMAWVLATSALPAAAVAALCPRWFLPHDTCVFLRSCGARLPLPRALQLRWGDVAAWGGAQ